MEASQFSDLPAIYYDELVKWQAIKAMVNVSVGFTNSKMNEKSFFSFILPAATTHTAVGGVGSP